MYRGGLWVYRGGLRERFSRVFVGYLRGIESF